MKGFPGILRMALFATGCLLLLVTCVKEYSYEGGKGTASYSFSGAPDACTGAVVAGNYYKGVPLTAVNTVTATVYVSVAGSFNVSTTTTHGISYAGTGNFTDTGFQTVTLTGSGIPDSTGSLTIAIPGTQGCFFNIDVTTEPPASFILSGEPNDCESPVIGGEYVVGTPMRSSDTVRINVLVSGPGDYQVYTDTVDGISFTAAGRFTTAGNQTITLLESGTPNEPGIQYFRLTAGASQCTFTVDVLNTAPYATYVLESNFGDPNPCVYTVNGTYASNVALTNANTVEINAYVTEVGNFSISTERLNGMQFSLSGKFDATGKQYPVLIGNGKPLSPGTFTFQPRIVGPAPLGGTTCAFTITVR
mgnify:FL=1